MRRFGRRATACGLLACALGAPACSDPVTPPGATGGAAGLATGGAAGGAGASGASAGSGTAGATAGASSGGLGGATAGSTGIGGTGGQAGSAGSLGGAGMPAAGAGGAGAGGGAGAAGAGGGTATPSAGCGTPANQALAQWVAGTLNVGGTDRQWWVWLPTPYDPNRAYPVIFLLHGCGTETNNVPMQGVAMNNAILVRGKAVTDCWDTGTNSPDIAFFDAMLAAVSANRCVDTARVFAVGYSSGSFLVNTLSCVRGDVLRAAGSVAGGSPRRNANACTGTVARVFVHDRNDPDNAITGSETERERLLALNGCNTALAPVPEDPAPCARYQGCDPAHPVIWCETMGQGHGRQDNLAAAASWGLFTEL